MKTWVLLAVISLLWAACGDSPPQPARGPASEVAKAPSARLSGRGSSVTPGEPEAAVTPLPTSLTGPVPVPGDRSGRTVRVLDACGSPVVGAQVHPLRSPEHVSVTDANGEADPGPLGGWHVVEPWTVVVRADGYVPHQHQVSARSDAHETVVLTTRGHPIAGRCVDSSGEGVSGVRIVLHTDGPGIEMQSDESGFFRTQSAPAERALLQIKSKTWIARSRLVVPPSESITLTLYRPTVVKVRLDLAGSAERNPAAFHVMAFRPRCHRDSFDPDTHEVEIIFFPGPVALMDGEDTLFVLDLREGETRDLGVLLLPPDRKTEQEIRTRRARRPPRERPHVDLRFGALEPGEIRVVGGFEERPIADLRYVRAGRAARVTLPAGQLLWLGVSRGDGPPLHDLEPVCWRQPAMAGATVCLEPPPAVRVRVSRLHRAHEDVRGGTLVLRWPGSLHWACALVRDETGTEQVRDVGPGTYDLVWHRGTYGETILLRRDVVVPAGAGTVELGEVALREPVVMSVRVEDARGRPIEGAVVTYWQGTSAREHALRTDRDGCARFALSDPTQLTVVAEAEGFESAGRKLDTLDDGGLVVMRLED